MGILEVRDDDLHNLISPDTQLEQIATGFEFIEGPIWHPERRSVIFSDILGNTLYRWTAAEGIAKLRINSYMANGNAYDQQGRVVTCEHATSCLSRTDFAASGEREVLASHYDGRGLNSPNDVVVRRDGTIYFTDPPFGRWEKAGVPRELELPFRGVYRLNPATRALTLLVDDFDRPNGLCFSADETLLYINDSARQHILVFEVLEDGTLSAGRLFAELVGDGIGVADGMKVDVEGNVWTCGPSGIHVFSSDGDCLGVVRMPEHTANLVFGDDDRCSLYITASTSLYRVRVRVPGRLTYNPGIGER